MNQPVTKDKNNEGEVIMMDMADVLYIQTEDGAVVFHTSEGRVYPLVPSLSMYAKHTESLGFQKLDRTNLVNMNKLRAFDEKRGLVFFDEDSNLERQSAIVAFMNIGKLKNMIISWIERNLK
ncbi:LytTR family transcriptional regulator DNA-binding domain-containing protein [Cohnella luojiensis]|uniref:LytR family transcriptional regulator n=1 Tax=Cohnella luojiensis TaxID=652876 RepID=A0A4Y8LUL5_9BACL|nr:LytTR family transcriptional regulator DNA-binding domain-containing protein [Cohnella luojiensis]TFE22621.1 LytR family transcriptional regulator [Cohnella luojiensis]